MRYSEYRIEDGVLVNGVVKKEGKMAKYFNIENEMTSEEKLEFIKEYYPEYDETIKELEMLDKAVDEGKIKITKYGHIRINSANKWIREHGIKHIICENPYRRWDDSSKEIVVKLNDAEVFHGYWDTVGMNITKELKNIDELFHSILSYLYVKEERFHKEREKDNYEKANELRIKEGKKAYQLINETNISMPYFIEQNTNESDFKEFNMAFACFRNSFFHKDFESKFSKNEYGELTFHNGTEREIVSEDKAKLISYIMLKYGQKVKELVDSMRNDLKEIMECIDEEKINDFKKDN